MVHAPVGLALDLRCLALLSCPQGSHPTGARTLSVPSRSRHIAVVLRQSFETF
jgi:hypothetical protein